MNATRPLVLVYIEDHPKTLMLLRAARKRAQEMNAKWGAVCVETPDQADRADDGMRERMLRQLTLAMQMGGEAIHLEAPTLIEGLRRVFEAHKERLALCIVGCTESRSGWRFWRKPVSLWQQVMRFASGYVPVEKMLLTGEPFTQGFWSMPPLRMGPLRHLAYALLAVGFAYVCALALEGWMAPALFRINNQNVLMLFLIACTFAAGRYGMVPGVLAAIAGIFTANYSFPELFHGVSISNVTDMLNMVLFIFAAVLVALFTRRAYAYAERLDRREIATQALFTLYRIAATSFSRGQALEKLQRKLTHMLKMEVAFFLPPALNPEGIEVAHPANLTLDEGDRKALDVCWSEAKTTGIAAPFNPGTCWRFEPMLASSGEIGVLGVRPRAEQKLDPWYGRLISAIADQTASVLEHIELERSMENTRLGEEREKLRSMLLSSVSHDLKTPLSGIIGALSAVQTLSDRLAPARRADLLETALEEAHRLDAFITNILEMTRLENKKIELRQEWRDIVPLVKQVEERLTYRLQRHSLIVHPVPQDIQVYMDAVMTGQVLQNLIDNACKYTAAGTLIELSCRVDEQGFCLEVRDHGEGLPPDKLLIAFDKYARLHKRDSQVAGTGLGLAICKALMNVQGGWINAANHPEGGALFTFCLPQWRKKPQREAIPAAVAKERDSVHPGVDGLAVASR